MDEQIQKMAGHQFVYTILELFRSYKMAYFYSLLVACYNVLQPQLVTPDKIKW